MHERGKLDAALHEARGQLEALKSQLADPAKAQILDAHQELLEDPDLVDLAISGISLLLAALALARVQEPSAGARA